jgi:adenylate cyclase
MKAFLLVLTILLSLFVSNQILAQGADIQQLENDLRSASGATRVEIFVALSDAYLQAGNLDKALSNAEEGANLASRIKRYDLQAVSLNREGKALAAKGRKGLFGKDLAAAKFRESNQILQKKARPDRALLLDNLEQLRAIAVRSGRKDDIAEIDAQIARANDIASPLPPSAPIAPERNGQEVKEQLTVISDQILELSKTTGSATQQRLNYERERQMMQAELSASRALIDKMSEDQLKATLLVMQQRTKLDSLEYQNKLDSLNVANAELAVRESRSERNFYLAALVAVFLLAGGSMFSYVRARQNARVLSEKNKIIRAEQERSENLLLNILPALVAEELKRNGSTSARYFEDVSVLFADFVGFSQIAEKLTPQQLVSELDTCFRAFDEIIAKHNLEKIKTIGDAYMAAGGLPNGGGSQLRDMIEAAREMQEWLAIWNAERVRQKLPVFEARIGIHSGPVVAGVVGSRKFAFDIWGDTVNIASRIESAGEGGKINISGEVHKVIKDYFKCQYRGKIAAKNKGEIDMYFVEN